MTKLIRIGVLGLIALVSLPAQAISTATSSYYLTWSGELFNNSALAQGWITLSSGDGAKFSGVVDSAWLAPDADVLDFSITVSNAGSGNGSFGLADFDFFMFSTKAAGVWPSDIPPELVGSTSAGLDLSRELVGQNTQGGAWGSDVSFQALTGDFNMFSKLLGFGAPTSAGTAFTIATNDGNGDMLALTSFQPVPIPAGFWLFGPALLGLGRFGVKRSQPRYY